MVPPCRALWSHVLLHVLLLIAACILLRPADPAFARQEEAPRRVKVLFLGDHGHHEPAARARALLPVFTKAGIDVFYTDQLADLNLATLRQYDALLLYANYDSIAPPQEKALLDYVAGGGGFVPVHCASYCFRNSEPYVALVGAQFARHGWEKFSTRRDLPDHPAIQGVPPLESWDESYVHTKHNPDRIVLEHRVDEEGEEPYTWVRTHGQGRVFYTAWGHDEQTWSQPAFQQLLERGVRWAAGDWALNARPEPAPFTYAEAPVPLPYYPPGEQWGTVGEPVRQMQQPLSPEASQRRLVLPPGFAARLFAAEPDIAKPIALAWDARGRLWIAETTDYPNELKPGTQGSDRIKICEDTDGDGRADKFTVFADSLSIPTSLVFANGGVIVAQLPHTLFLRDTDGDDRADVREVLFTGWGTFDTHAGPSHFRWGFDNWIWGVVGYSGFDGTVGDTHRTFGQGLYRFKPDGSALEVVRSTNNNTWGLGFTEDGFTFASTANDNPSVFVPIPGRYYESVRGWSPPVLGKSADDPAFYPITDDVRQVDQHGRYTAGAGHELYTARSFPQEYWNRAAFVAGPTGHLLGRFDVSPRGSDFAVHNRWNLLASDDAWTAPIDASVGPDGALWMIDWYNIIVQHNPVPPGYEKGAGNAYEIPLRDKTHGRIYRIVYEDAAPPAALRLDQAAPDALIAALRHDNLLWRMTAQRLLVERGQRDVLPALYALVHDPSVDELGLSPGALHALWTLHGLGALAEGEAEALAVATDALEHPAASIRRAALQVLPSSDATRQAILDDHLLEDPDAAVRLAALLALADQPPAEDAGAAIFATLVAPENAEDAWIPDAATAAGAQHAVGFLNAAVAASEAARDLRARRGVTQNLPERVQDVIGRVSFHYVDGLLKGETAALPSAGPQASTAGALGKRPDANGVVTISPVGNNLEYDTKVLEAKAGSQLTLRFVNTATSAAMNHNVVLLKSWDDVNTVGSAAITDGDSNYIPPEHADKIVAHTPLAGPGQTVEVTFTVPPAGEYPYICTFTGHYVAMQGTLVSTE